MMREAQAVCENCPVRDPCLEEALRWPEMYDHGVWGGTSERERRFIRDRRRVARTLVSIG